MASPSIPVPGLLTLPNELLLAIACPLSTSTLRLLSKVNHHLYFFVRAYLIRHRYTHGLLTLPNELLLEITAYLGTQSDRSHFARTSQHFYPVVMNYIVRFDIRYRGSSMLNVAARRNLKGVARSMLRMGGEVNTQHGFQALRTGERPTPLLVAALLGHERMVRLFLGAGAQEALNDVRMPLLLAIAKGHEGIAVLLARDLDADDTIATPGRGRNVLLLACRARFVHLVRGLLERCALQGKRVDARKCSAALYMLLEGTASKGAFRARELLEDVHQIVLMLLGHGADPDLVVTGVGVEGTARSVAQRCPDPRVRNLLLKAARTVDRPPGKNTAVSKLQEET
jgi:hypothetical protein